ncbi:MAG: hypothetical protein ACC656_13255, partial [Candidatus Heimdallarchaeota archaeon]
MYVEQRSEGECLISIHAIIIMSQAGIPFFEDRFNDFSMDPTLVAGVSSALTMYMDDLTSDTKKGIQQLKKAGLTISSSKTNTSTIVIISEYDLSPIVLEQIQNSQIMIEEYYADKFSGRDRSRDLMDANIVYQIFDDSGFKIGLKKALQIHEDNIIAIKEDRSIGPTLRFHLGSLRELIPGAETGGDGGKITNLNTIVSHLKARNVDNKTIGNLVVLAYE